MTICHSRTQDLQRHTLDADVLVAAVGRAHLISADMVKAGATVIDVGMNRVEGAGRCRATSIRAPSSAPRT